MNIDLIVKLTSRAWSLDILAQLVAGVPGRQAPLLAATGASRNAFAQSMQHLIALGLVERNPGYGHPLRPEFRLTELGQAVGPSALRVRNQVSEAQAAAMLRRAWVLPVLAVSAKPRRFGDIRAQLTPITDRALSLTLQRLQQVRWLDRQVTDTGTAVYPVYQAANTGRDIAAAIAA